MPRAECACSPGRRRRPDDEPARRTAQLSNQLELGSELGTWLGFVRGSDRHLGLRNGSGVRPQALLGLARSSARDSAWSELGPGSAWDSRLCSDRLETGSARGSARISSWLGQARGSYQLC